MNTYSEIEAKDLSVMMASQPLLLVDVRNEDEVVRGMIAGAIHIPLAALPAQYALLPKSEPIVFYCHSGIRSAHAAAFVAGNGYKHAYNLIGGVLAWGREGLPFVPKSS